LNFDPASISIRCKRLTLDEFTIRFLRNFLNATGELSRLLRDIGLAVKRINMEVNKASIADILGYNGSVNVQGEDVMKLDEFSNRQFVDVIKNGISCAGIVN
jgi:fructose-1,6-bisphosphatase I